VEPNDNECHNRLTSEATVEPIMLLPHSMINVLRQQWNPMKIMLLPHSMSFILINDDH
jgi:hypothetical protein